LYLACDGERVVHRGADEAEPVGRALLPTWHDGAVIGYEELSEPIALTWAHQGLEASGLAVEQRRTLGPPSST
jgi:hypothetical protein